MTFHWYLKPPPQWCKNWEHWLKNHCHLGHYRDQRLSVFLQSLSYKCLTIIWSPPTRLCAVLVSANSKSTMTKDTSTINASGNFCQICTRVRSNIILIIFAAFWVDLHMRTRTPVLVIERYFFLLNSNGIAVATHKYKYVKICHNICLPGYWKEVETLYSYINPRRV